MDESNEADGSSPKKKTRTKRAVGDETYDIMLTILKDQFNVPVKYRTNVHKAAMIKLHRGRDKYHLRLVDGEEKIFYSGKELVKKSDIQKIITEESKNLKFGCRKLSKSLRKKFGGISEKMVSQVIKNKPKKVLEWRINPYGRDRAARPVNQETYETMLLFLKKQFNVPCKERTNAQKAAIIKLNRARGIYTVQVVNGEEKIFVHGKELLKLDDVEKTVLAEVDEVEVKGCRSLKSSMRTRFDGISERRICRVLKSHQLLSRQSNRKGNNPRKRSRATKTNQELSSEGDNDYQVNKDVKQNLYPQIEQDNAEKELSTPWNMLGLQSTTVGNWPASACTASEQCVELGPESINRQGHSSGPVDLSYGYSIPGNRPHTETPLICQTAGLGLQHGLSPPVQLSSRVATSFQWNPASDDVNNPVFPRNDYRGGHHN